MVLDLDDRESHGKPWNTSFTSSAAAVFCALHLFFSETIVLLGCAAALMTLNAVC